MGRLEQDYRGALDGLRFSDAGKERIMNNLMEQAGRPVKGKRFRPLRTALIAAALCLALVGTAGAVQFFGVRVDLQRNPDHPGENYTAKGGIAFFSADSFPQQIYDMAAPGKTAGRYFDTWAELEAFLDRELPGSAALESAQPGPRWKSRNSQEKSTHILLSTFFTEDRELVSIRAAGHYLLDGIWVQQSARLYTDKMEENYRKYGLEGGKFEGGIVMLYEEGSVMAEETYTTPGGLTVDIVKVTPPQGSSHPITEYNAHFSIGGIQYHVSASTYAVGYTRDTVPEDPAHTLDVLKQVLDGFVLE